FHFGRQREQRNCVRNVEPGRHVAQPCLPSQSATPRAVRGSDRSNLRPDGAIETSSSLTVGLCLRNCVRSVEIVIKSFRFQIVSGLVPFVAFVMTEITTQPKTSETKASEYSSR